MQALTDLLLLPPAITAFVQQQVAAFQAPLAVTVVEPGHCLWQVRKASVTLPAVPPTPFAGSDAGKSSLLECVFSTAQGFSHECILLRNMSLAKSTREIHPTVSAQTLMCTCMIEEIGVPCTATVRGRKIVFERLTAFAVGIT